jgi:hypothetical protein
MISLNWQGSWIVAGETRKNRGAGKLIFQKDTMKLVKIDGDNPFALPSIN